MRRLLKGFRRRFENTFVRNTIFCIDLPTYQYPSGLRDDLTIRRAGRDEFTALAADPAYEITSYELQNSIEIMGQGDECWVAELEGVVVFYVFVQFTSRQLSPGRRLYLAPDAVFLIRGCTVAWMRGRRLAPSTVARVALDLKARGYARMFTDIPVFNRPSLNYATHAGFPPVGYYLEFNLGQRCWALVPRRMIRMITERPN
ncbi:MAG: hypothetical protein KJ621_13790 [Proteobacteria bacterium]|nr:hypothetical protein [Pseudomonadota bacterium]